jgi:phosphohistidine phosphatase SixA
MKHFFLARHGSYYLNGHLNQLGQRQIRALGKEMKQILNGSSVYIISSTAPRALDSSEILASELDGAERIEAVPELWFAADTNHYERVCDFDPRQIYEIVQERRDHADALILMAHEEFRNEFASYFAEKEFGKTFSFDVIYKGQADHFCLTEETCNLIPKVHQEE